MAILLAAAYMGGKPSPHDWAMATSPKTATSPSPAHKGGDDDVALAKGGDLAPPRHYGGDIALGRRLDPGLCFP
ncbi:UNVERIFIED_CONTAM: hypothetical protein Slati_2743900 [Sesamum latifolium]|uniref:Uncharacterized protein n=1 Tax=Sesamum latifolium TaxID=2727402 RepID=A0AAW2W1S8_9LAMI